MLTPRHNHRTSPAFTIVELLIVIAIISVLASLMLPSLTAARRKALQIKCLVIERNYFSAFNNYGTDHKGFYPYANKAQTPVTTGSYLVFGSQGTLWTQALAGYYEGSLLTGTTATAANTRVAANLRCPANPWYYGGGGGGIWTGATYAMNGYAGQSSPFPYSYGIGSDPAVNPANFIRQKRHDNLRRPSSLCLIAEIPNVTPGGTAFPWSNTNWGAVFLDRTAFTSGSTLNNTWKSQIATYGRDATEVTAYTRVNHDLGWNVLHADGSARYYAKNTMERISTNTANGTAYSSFWLDN
jgi:prepilin-type N-terminal cleavage/methylation domain-containing protein